MPRGDDEIRILSKYNEKVIKYKIIRWISKPRVNIKRVEHSILVKRQHFIKIYKPLVLKSN